MKTAGGGGRGPARLGEVLGRFLDDSGLRQQVERMAVLDAWSACVGERIAKETRARSVSGTTLVVEVSSSAWMQELHLMKAEILRQLQTGCEGAASIERIVFVLGGDAEDGAR